MGKLMVGLTRLLPFYILALFLPSIAAGSSISVDVDSKLGWQSTSLTVSQGQLITFSAAGAWSVDFRNFPYVGPDGYSPDVDQTIYQGCKLDPKLPYGGVLARIGTDPFWPVGDGGTFTARSSGVLSLRIHDGDPCLGDNDGFIKVTLTISSSSVPPVTSTELPPFYCIIGPNGSCPGAVVNPVKGNPLPSPPEWLTSPLLPQCLSQLSTDVGVIITLLLGRPDIGALILFSEPPGSPVKLISTVIGIEPELERAGGLQNPLYLATIIQAFIQDKVNVVTLQSCRDLLQLLDAAAQKVPAAPTNIGVSVTSGGTAIGVSWKSNSNNELGFDIFNGVEHLQVGRGQTFISSDWGGLSPGQYMCVQVRSYNVSGSSEPTPWSCTTMPR
jgi:hypothetical protein